MRLLHFADLHLDTPFAWAGAELARARRTALRQTLGRICTVAAETGVDALTCAGDLYEQDRFGPDTVEFLRATFAGIHPLPVLLAPGNHDWYGPASLYRQAAWSPNVHVFDAAALVPVTLADGFTVWGAGHLAPASTPGLLDGFHVDRGGVHCALFHGSERGSLGFQGEGKLPHSPFRAEQVPAAGLHHALVGHFHRPVDGVHHTYPGNPDPLAFGETGPRAAVLVTVDAAGGVARERIAVASAQAHDVRVDVTGCTHGGEVVERVRDTVGGLFGAVRVTLDGELGPDVDLHPADLVALRGGSLEAVVPRLGALTVAYDVQRLGREPTVRGQFVRDVLAAPELTAEQRRRVLVTGLRALDGRSGELEVH